MTTMVSDGATIPELEDPWPTFEDATATASYVAEQAFQVYGDLLHSVWMYGSRARGDHQPDSDLDLLLVKTSREADPRDSLRRKLRRRLSSGGLDAVMGILLSLHTGSIEQLEHWDTMFYRNVRADAVRVA